MSTVVKNGLTALAIGTTMYRVDAEQLIGPVDDESNEEGYVVDERTNNEQTVTKSRNQKNKPIIIQLALFA